MAKQDPLTLIDQAITALTKARQALAIADRSKKVTLQGAKSGLPKRGMSEEGRQRVAEAQRKRWAKQKRAAKKAARVAAQ